MDKELIIKRNKKLCEEMPFLIPRNRWSGKKIDEYDYQRTELDLAEIPLGWNKLFLDFCKEITPLLKEADYLYKYRLLQVKEKYASLRIYTNSIPESIYDRYEEIERKYVELSEQTCCNCGHSARIILLGGYYIPMCKSCYDAENRKYSYAEVVCEME